MVTDGVLAPVDGRQSTQASAIVPANRRRYLAEIAETVQGYHATTARLADEARRAEQVAAAIALGLASAESTPVTWPPWPAGSRPTATPKAGDCWRSGRSCGRP